MIRNRFILIIILVLTALCDRGQASSVNNETITKIEMNLSAFGVESDDFPSIVAVIDFSKNTSVCVKSYYNPRYKNATYSLSRTEMADILNLLKIQDLKKLRKDYRVSITDQPESKTVVYTTIAKYIVSDYGLKGAYPLQDLYKIVYKF